MSLGAINPFSPSVPFEFPGEPILDAPTEEENRDRIQAWCDQTMSRMAERATVVAQAAEEEFEEQISEITYRMNHLQTQIRNVRRQGTENKRNMIIFLVAIFVISFVAGIVMVQIIASRRPDLFVALASRIRMIA